MNPNIKWVVLAGAVAAFGGSACSPDKGSGDSTEGICDSQSDAFDEDACWECWEKVSDCESEGVCDSRFEAAQTCAFTGC
ncbi:MAG TPA: hypothetical protein VGD74_08575, partial [Vulgatibacter sp.]